MASFLHLKVISKKKSPRRSQKSQSSFYWKAFYSYCCCCLVTKSCLILCSPMNSACQASLSFTKFAQTHVHWVSDAIQPSHPFPSPPTFNLSHHQGLFQWVGSLHQVAKELELQFQHQSFQWISLDIKMLKKKKKNPRKSQRTQPSFYWKAFYCTR